jgi:hypothetical protein
VANNPTSKSDAKELKSSCFTEMIRVLCFSFDKNPEIIQKLNGVLIYTIKNFGSLFTLSLIDMDYSKILIAPQCDLAYLTTLASKKDLDMFNNLFVAYRQYRNDINRL